LLRLVTYWLRLDFHLHIWSVTLDRQESVLVVPFLWSLLGFSAALRWGVLEDVMLIITGLVASAMIIYRARTSRDVTPAYPA